MAGLTSVSGLASGVQWLDLIDQIIEAKSRPKKLVEAQIERLQARSSAWSTLGDRIRTLQEAAERLADVQRMWSYRAEVAGGAAGAAPVAVTTGPGAGVGSYRVRVLALATQEKLAGGVVASRSEALRLSGEFLVNGTVIRVAETDSLESIAARINGASGAGVTATIVSVAPDEHRLVLTSTRSGAEGRIDLVDGAAGVLRALGFLEEAAVVKHQRTAGAASDVFSSNTTAVAVQRGLTDTLAGTVRIGGATGFDVALDLSTMSLDDVAAAINAAAAAAGSGVTASVVAEPGEAGWRLVIEGTASFTDASNRILEALGILEGGRSGVAQVIAGGQLLAGGAAATGATRFVDLDAGVAAGDTLTISGTRADGTTFTFDFQIDATTTLDDLIARLNAADALKGGSRTATASLADGRIVVRDDQSGESRLALSIVAHNEGGGALDFGTFAVTEAGRSRQLVAAADAELEIDGVYVRRASNTITDVIPGLTFDLRYADPATTVEVAVTRDLDAAKSAIEEFVNALNAVVDYVKEQSAAAPAGQARKPFSGDFVARSVLNQLRAALDFALPVGEPGAPRRLSDIGIEVDRNGRYQLNAEKLRAALEAHPNAVAQLFGAVGTSSAPGLDFIVGPDRLTSGTFEVEITAPATRATVLTAFDGVYNDDGVADELRITDFATGATYTIVLENGLTTAQILERLQTELGTARRRRLESREALRDADGDAATEATTLAELRRADGSSLGIQDGDVLMFSGTRSNGTAFVVEYTVQDASAVTLGELRAFLQSQLGSEAVVSITDGVLSVEAAQAGQSRLSLAVSSSNPATGNPFGVFDVAVEGRSAARIRAELEDGQIRLTHEDYGSNAGFDIALVAGGADGTGQLGLVAQAYRGQDVQGTINGTAANGSGTVLRGPEGTEIEGLVLSYTGTATGAVGSVTFSRGVAAAIADVAKQLLQSGTGTVPSVLERIDASVRQLQDRVAQLEDRLERQREQLILRFAALEQALAQAQAQSQWLAGQLAQFGTQRAR